MPGRHQRFELECLRELVDFGYHLGLEHLSPQPTIQLTALRIVPYACESLQLDTGKLAVDLPGRCELIVG